MRNVLLTLLSLVALVATTPAQAQSPEEMKKWMDAMTPSDVHKMMAEWDGVWEENIKMWMEPGAPAQDMKATVTNTMILGGRYQEQKHSGMMMGMPFEGISVTGWDNTRKVFVSTWMDNMSTSMMYMEGTWDAAKKTMNLKGKMTDPISGQQLDIRQVLYIINNDQQKLEQYTTHDGKEFLSMEIMLIRKK